MPTSMKRKPRESEDKRNREREIERERTGDKRNPGTKEIRRESEADRVMLIRRQAKRSALSLEIEHSL